MVAVEPEIPALRPVHESGWPAHSIMLGDELAQRANTVRSTGATQVDEVRT